MSVMHFSILFIPVAEGRERRRLTHPVCPLQLPQVTARIPSTLLDLLKLPLNAVLLAKVRFYHLQLSSGLELKTLALSPFPSLFRLDEPDVRRKLSFVRLQVHR